TDLPVDNCVRCLQRPRNGRCHARESRRQRVAVPRYELTLAAPHVRKRAVAVPLHLEAPIAAVRQLRGQCREHGRVAPPSGLLPVLVATADDQPVLLLAVEVRGDERPRAPEPLALEANGQLTVRLLADQLVRAVVPDLDRPRAVLAGRDLTGE